MYCNCSYFQIGWANASLMCHWVPRKYYSLRWGIFTLTIVLDAFRLLFEYLYHSYYILYGSINLLEDTPISCLGCFKNYFPVPKLCDKDLIKKIFFPHLNSIYRNNVLFCCLPIAFYGVQPWIWIWVSFCCCFRNSTDWYSSSKQCFPASYNKLNYQSHSCVWRK